MNYGLTGPDLPVASNLAMILLFNLNAVVLLLLVVLLFRNLVKLWFERRQKVVASQFKAKLVLAFLFLSLVPTILIIIIASTIINRSIDGWFKPQVERPLDQALAVAQAYYQNLESTALRHAQQIAHVIARDDLLDPPQHTALRLYLTEQQQQLGLGGVTVLAASGQERIHVNDPALADLPLRSVGRDPAQAGPGRPRRHQRARGRRGRSRGRGDPHLVGAGRRAEGTTGVVVVSTHVPERLEAKVRGISQAFKEYKQLRLLKTPIKVNLILFFVLITLMIVFCFTWFGLYLARGITGPIEQLVEGTREVAAGNLNYKVETRADDEIGVLVDSFNRMTDDLSLSKRQLEEAYLDLQDKHTELEERRRYIETVLEAITTGVVSFDAVGRLTTINRAAARMFDLSEEASVGRLLEEVFQGPEGREIVSLVRRAGRAQVGAVAAEITREHGGTAAVIPRLGHRPARSRGRIRGGGAGLRRPDRADQGPAAGGLARGRPAAGPRDQEPPHAHPALRPAPAPAAGRAGRRTAAAGERVHGDHHPGGRQPEAAGRGVLAVRPHARPDPAAHRHPAASSSRSPASTANPIRPSPSPRATPRPCPRWRWTPTTSSARC